LLFISIASSSDSDVMLTETVNEILTNRILSNSSIKVNILFYLLLMRISEFDDRDLVIDTNYTKIIK
jgi:hypothetical protein